MNQTNMTETHDLVSDRYDSNQNGAIGPKEPLSSTRYRWGGQGNTTQGESHHQQHPARRRNNAELSRPSRPRQTLISGFSIYIAIVVLISCCCSLTTAAAIGVEYIPEKIYDPLADIGSEELRLALAHLAESGTIVVDSRPPPPPAGGNYWQIENTEREGLIRRDGADDSSSTTAPSHSTASSSRTSSSTSSSAPSSAPSTTVAGSTTSSSSGSAASGTASPSPLPSPFDSTLGNNFTAPSCPTFLYNFLNNDTFKACLPFSLLLESSQSFFRAEKSVVLITQTLDATCAANVTSCTALMSAFANNLTADANCGADFLAENPTVLAAHTGLIAYEPLYTASCLKNPKTSSYCFADAVTNASSPTDSYVYYLALNTSLPGGSQPTCNACLQATMNVFDAAAANRSQPVASTYVAAAQQINVNCGPGFVNASIPAAVSGASSLNMVAGAGIWPGVVTLLACAITAAGWL